MNVNKFKKLKQNYDVIINFKNNCLDENINFVVHLLVNK